MMIKTFSLGLLTVMLAGCATSAEPGYYALAQKSGAVVQDVNFTVKIQRPTLAGYLDRPEIVRQDSDFEIQIDDSSHWAEPLDTMFERVLLQDLQQRLPSANVFTEDNENFGDPRVVLALDVQQFNEVAHDKVALDGSLNIKDKGVHIQPPAQHVQYVVDEDASSAPENLSVLVGKLADDIAKILHNQVVQGDNIAPKPVTAPPEE